VRSFDEKHLSMQDALNFSAMDISSHEFEGYFDRLTGLRPERADLRGRRP
jgi:hypothetical protein